MALDQTLLERAAADGTTVFRLYHWSEDTISFGANEPALRHWSRPRIEAAGTATVRRPTGGRAVWHAASDLTYGWTAVADRIGSAAVAYHQIHARWVQAFERLGVAATLAPPPARLPGLRRGACFENAVGGEVIVQGEKLIGSAQLVTRGGLLQHGEVSFGDRLAPLNALRQEPIEATRPALWPSLPPVAELETAIAEAWLASGARMAPVELTTWAERASVQHVGRYRDPVWTWRR
ncbi:MAG: hypothetical protein ABJC19_02625 [Gemmatimonadota bacterium]